MEWYSHSLPFIVVCATVQNDRTKKRSTGHHSSETLCEYVPCEYVSGIEYKSYYKSSSLSHKNTNLLLNLRPYYKNRSSVCDYLKFIGRSVNKKKPTYIDIKSLSYVPSREMTQEESTTPSKRRMSQLVSL